MRKASGCSEGVCARRVRQRRVSCRILGLGREGRGFGLGRLGVGGGGLREVHILLWGVRRMALRGWSGSMM